MTVNIGARLDELGPANVFEVHFDYMHGDADAFTNISVHYPQDKERQFEIVVSAFTKAINDYKSSTRGWKARNRSKKETPNILFNRNMSHIPVVIQIVVLDTPGDR